MPKVFVTQEPVQRWNSSGTAMLPVHDLTPARAYGDLHFMFPPAQNLYVVTAPVVAEARRQLSGFTDNDYILAIGSPVMMGIVCSIASELNGGRYKVLVWDKKLRMYLEYKVNTRGQAT